MWYPFPILDYLYYGGPPLCAKLLAPVVHSSSPTVLSTLSHVPIGSLAVLGGFVPTFDGFFLIFIGSLLASDDFLLVFGSFVSILGCFLPLATLRGLYCYFYVTLTSLFIVFNTSFFSAVHGIQYVSNYKILHNDSSLSKL